MMSAKKKKVVKKPAAALDVDQLGELGEQLNYPADPSWTATEQLMDMLFNAWAAQIGGRCFHWMTRTFAHHRLGQPYDMERIFGALDQVNGGDHAALLRELVDFRRSVFADLRSRLDRSRETE